MPVHYQSCFFFYHLKLINNWIIRKPFHQEKCKPHLKLKEENSNPCNWPNGDVGYLFADYISNFKAKNRHLKSKILKIDLTVWKLTRFWSRFSWTIDGDFNGFHVSGNLGRIAADVNGKVKTFTCREREKKNWKKLEKNYTWTYSKCW